MGSVSSSESTGIPIREIPSTIWDCDDLLEPAYSDTVYKTVNGSFQKRWEALQARAMSSCISWYVDSGTAE